MKRLSDELNELSARAKKTEDVIQAAVAQDRERLQARLNTLKTAVENQPAKARADVDTKWQELHTKLDDLFAGIRAKAEEHKTERDIRHAEHRADDAEQDAIVAVDFAVYALDQAEYAIIEAAVCRAEADELAAQR